MRNRVVTTTGIVLDRHHELSSFCQQMHRPRLEVFSFVDNEGVLQYAVYNLKDNEFIFADPIIDNIKTFIKEYEP